MPWTVHAPTSKDSNLLRFLASTGSGAAAVAAGMTGMIMGQHMLSAPSIAFRRLLAGTGSAAGGEATGIAGPAGACWCMAEGVNMLHVPAGPG